MARSSTLLPALFLATLSSAYQWPNPALDALEGIRWDQTGYPTRLLGTFVNPCDQFFPNENSGHRTNAADWLRTAYHDMAPHNVTTGEGGLDASIQFTEEQSRPENAGDGFANTLLAIRPVPNRYVSLADAIALAAVYAVEQCGGPKIPFRSGRVDATSPNKPGVPQPEESLDSHTASFARQGFTPTEMIQLVACGHTLGGVQNQFFPNVVPGGGNNQGNVHFDSSFDNFDNHVATDYISGNTSNPLVVTSNVTTRSDLRIFSSDKNATMKALAASNDLFRSTCADLLERMINTVPKNVQLGDVIEPLPVRPEITMYRASNGTFIVTGQVRFWYLDDNNNPQVNVSWAGADGKKCNGCSASLSHIKGFHFSVSQPGNHHALWFIFPSAGIQISATSPPKFWFEINQKNGTLVEDNGGVGFPLLQKVVLSGTSCVIRGGFDFGRLDIAVKKGLQPSKVFLEGSLLSSDGSHFIPKGVATYSAVLNSTASSKDAAYDIYTANVTGARGQLNVAATIDGKNVSDWATFTLGTVFFDGEHYC